MVNSIAIGGIGVVITTGAESLGIENTPSIIGEAENSIGRRLVQDRKWKERKGQKPQALRLGNQLVNIRKLVIQRSPSDLFQHRCTRRLLSPCPCLGQGLFYCQQTSGRACESQKIQPYGLKIQSVFDSLLK